MILEVAAFDLETAVEANKNKFCRIELCENYSVGGITPDNNLIINVLNKVSIDVFLMLRCRPGNFVYNTGEINSMINRLKHIKKLNVKGIVFGALDINNRVDKNVCREVVSAAAPLPVTFHRAIDLCDDLNDAVVDVIECGFKRILTSGGKFDAHEGRFELKKLIQNFGDKIIIVPGGGIRDNNFREIIDETNAMEIHSSKILKFI